MVKEKAVEECNSQGINIHLDGVVVVVLRKIFPFADFNKLWGQVVRDSAQIIANFGIILDLNGILEVTQDKGFLGGTKDKVMRANIAMSDLLFVKFDDTSDEIEADIGVL